MQEAPKKRNKNLQQLYNGFCTSIVFLKKTNPHIDNKTYLYDPRRKFQFFVNNVEI